MQTPAHILSQSVSLPAVVYVQVLGNVDGELSWEQNLLSVRVHVCQIRACVCERECVPACVCVCVGEREKDRECVCVRAWICSGVDFSLLHSHSMRISMSALLISLIFIFGHLFFSHHPNSLCRLAAAAASLSQLLPAVSTFTFTASSGTSRTGGTAVTSGRGSS